MRRAGFCFSSSCLSFGCRLSLSPLPSLADPPTYLLFDLLLFCYWPVWDGRLGFGKDGLELDGMDGKAVNRFGVVPKKGGSAVWL